MQASKIEIGKTYALKRNDGFVRFVVGSVITTRYQNTGSPHDYKSTVKGRIVEDRPSPSDDNVMQWPVIEVQPADVLGPYQQHAELVERDRAEKAAVQQRDEAEKDNARQLRLAFYALIGEQVPGDDREFRQLFRVSMYDVDMSREAVARLLAALKRRADLKVAS